MGFGYKIYIKRFVDCHWQTHILDTGNHVKNTSKLSPIPYQTPTRSRFKI